MAEKYFGKYRGKVTAVDNSDGMWRIKANVPKLLGGYNTGWALPCLGFAFGGAQAFFKVSVGDMVWIEFERGDIDLPIWTGGWFLQGKAPNKIGIKMNGTLLEWDDDGLVVHGNLVINGAVLCSSLTASAEDGTGTIEAEGGISTEGNITVEGTVTSEEDVLVGSISLKNHKHSGIERGSGTTDSPQ